MKLYTINLKDNVAINLEHNKPIKYGHKIALKDIKKGEFVYKYGEIIGVASKNIKKGEWVHSHNLKSHLSEKIKYQYKPNFKIKYKDEHLFFYGFKHSENRIGIRNNIYIIPTVGCINGVVNKIKAGVLSSHLGSIDNIVAINHQFGCSQIGDDHSNFKYFLANLALNPNASYVLFVGLGCENNQIDGIKQILNKEENKHIKYLICQEAKNEVEEGIKIVKDFIKKASKFKRVKVPLSKIVVGLKCGGSDALSGITANPLVGKVCDRLILNKASTILTEVPEMFGAEQSLMNKCINKNIFNKYVNLINDFKDYFLKSGFPIYENPSPGNKEGGITTLEEKSLGCITKGGCSPIVDILSYCERVKKSGLNILEGPGNDLIATSVLSSAGAHLILFTTGRGTPYSSFVPTLKISTNDLLDKNKSHWIDFNAYKNDSDKLFNLILKTVNGKYKCKQEDNIEIAYFKKGVTL